MSTPARLADMIAAADTVMVFTGAGISTESGIPDFRSPGGVWSKMKPIYYQDFVASRDQRREAWRRVYTKAAGWVGAEPNSGHYAIASLVKRGKVNAIVTQNVDNLHQDSGVPDDQVIEIHGNASYAKCLQCGKRYEYEQLKPRWEADEDILCDFCTGLVKSATISFGQAMPEDEMRRAEAVAMTCDLCLVLGSSLIVYPAANIPIIAKQHGARLAIINRDPTDMDPIADCVINQGIGDVMAAVMQTLGAD